jgi:hypothetical protein
LLLGIGTHIIGIFIGVLVWDRAVVAPARRAVLVGLQSEVDLTEQSAVASFKKYHGDASIAAQVQFIEFVARREKFGWIEKRDAARAIGMAKIRLAVDFEAQGKRDARDDLVKEAAGLLHSAGISESADELAKILAREKANSSPKKALGSS